MLPEKWFIKRCNEVADWLDVNKQVNFSHSYRVLNKDLGCFHFPKLGNSHCSVGPQELIKEGYIKITIEQFREMIQEFKIPEKWAIKRDHKNYEIINKWLNAHCGVSYYKRNEHYIHYPNTDNGIGFDIGNHIGREIKEGYKEITFEQFKKYILMENKKIIGYKAPTDLFARDILKGEVYIKTHKSFNGYHPEKASTSTTYYLPDEIVEAWEPVYEEVSKDKEFTLQCKGGEFKLTVKKEGLYYSPDSTYLSPLELKEMLHPVERWHAGYRFASLISHLDMGCKKQVPVSDIKPLIEYWEANFKD